MAAFTSPSASDPLEDPTLSVWYNCLRQCDVHKKFVLPRGSENGSDDAELLALLGDSVLKVQILKVMGVLDSGAPRSSIRKLIAHTTARTAHVFSNEFLAEHSFTIICPAKQLNIGENDLALCSVHGRGMSVEAAVALVYQRFGDGAPLQNLAQFLLAKQGGLEHNHKSLFLEMGGRLVNSQTSKGFITTATCGTTDVEGYTCSSKLKAEQSAAYSWLIENDLGTDKQRNAVRDALAKQEMDRIARENNGQTSAECLRAKRGINFLPITVNETEMRRAPLDHAAWILKKGQKNTSRFAGMIRAPLALPL